MQLQGYLQEVKRLKSHIINNKMQLQEYLQEIKRLKFYIIPVFVVMTGTYLFYNYTDPVTAVFYSREDGIFEWGTALFYFAAFIYFILTFKKTKYFFVLLISVLMFFGAGEEISWGQRVIGFKTPKALERINVQKEFNVHNIGVFNTENLKGENAKGWSKLLVMNFLFKLFTWIFGVAIPLCVFHFKKISALNQKIRMPVAPFSIGIFFLFSEILYVCSYSAVPKTADFYWERVHAGEEYGEFISAFIMFVIALYFYNYSKKYIITKDIKQFTLP
jgi:hypothetical protein